MGKQPEWSKLYRDNWEQASEEVMHCELGNPVTEDSFRRKIQAEFDFADLCLHWPRIYHPQTLLELLVRKFFCNHVCARSIHVQKSQPFVL